MELRQIGMPGELDASEKAALSDLTERAAFDCHTLEQCGLPDTIVHSDLNETNIFASRAGKTALIDWTYCRISHPFFALEGSLFAPYSDELKSSFVRDLIRKSYLESWQGWTSMNRLITGLDAASRLVWIESAVDMLRCFKLLSCAEPGNLHALPTLIRRMLVAYGVSNSARGHSVSSSKSLTP